MEGYNGPKRLMQLARERLEKAIDLDGKLASRPSREIASNARNAMRELRENVEELKPVFRYKAVIRPKLLHMGRKGPAPRIQPVPKGQKPKLIVVVGQLGSGKTSLIENVSHGLEDRGGAVMIQSDDLERFHPLYRKLHEADDLQAHEITRQESIKWREMLVEDVIARRYNAVYESAAANIAGLAATIQRFHEKGYEVEVRALAVKPMRSRLSMIERFVYGRLREGFGRRRSPEEHDETYDGSGEVVRMVESGKIPADSLVLYDRDDVLFENRRGSDGQWNEPATGWETMEQARNRDLTPEEQRELEGGLYDVEAVVDVLMESDRPNRWKWEPVARDIVKYREDFGQAT